MFSSLHRLLSKLSSEPFHFPKEHLWNDYRVMDRKEIPVFPHFLKMYQMMALLSHIFFLHPYFYRGGVECQWLVILRTLTAISSALILVSLFLTYFYSSIILMCAHAATCGSPSLPWKQSFPSQRVFNFPMGFLLHLKGSGLGVMVCRPLGGCKAL